MKDFYCTNCYKDFKAKGYPNPCFYADTVADCKCGHKAWEKMITMTMSEFKRLKKLGVKPKTFN